MRNHNKAPLLWQVHPVVFLCLYFYTGYIRIDFSTFNSSSSEPKQSRKKEEATYQLLKLSHKRPCKNSLLQVLRTFQLVQDLKVEEGAPEFELKSSLINLVQATQFSGKAHKEFLRDWKHNPHQRSRQKYHTASPFSILTRREGEEVVLYPSR